MGFCFELIRLLNILMVTGSVYMLQVYYRVLSSETIPTLLGLFSIVVVRYVFLGVFDYLRCKLLTCIALQVSLQLGTETFSSWLTPGLQNIQEGQVRHQGEMSYLNAVQQFLFGPETVSLFDLPIKPIFLLAMF